MTEAVVERVEIEGSVEELYERWSKPETFCTFVRVAEETRRVDFSWSSWQLKAPLGRSTEYKPELLRRCLSEYYRDERVDEPAYRLEARWPHSSGEAKRFDLVCDRGVFEFKKLSADKTLVVLTTYYEDPTEASRLRHLDLYAIVVELLSDRRLGTALEATPEAVPGAQAAKTAEDHAWLENDLSRLGDYGPYEWAEGELEAYQPLRFVPGLGLVVEGEEGPEAGTREHS